jgi:hypothetical protein
MYKLHLQRVNEPNVLTSVIVVLCNTTCRKVIYFRHETRVRVVNPVSGVRFEGVYLWFI